MPCMQPAAAAAAPSRAGLTKVQTAHKKGPPLSSRELLLQKSGNLVIDRYWRTKVTDFYLSRLMVSQQTSPCLVADNMRWTAPEVITEGKYTTASDMYRCPGPPPVTLPVSGTWRIQRDVDAANSVMSAHFAGHSDFGSASLAGWLASLCWARAPGMIMACCRDCAAWSAGRACAGPSCSLLKCQYCLLPSVVLARRHPQTHHFSSGTVWRSFGIILWELLTWQIPFSSKAPMEVWQPESAVHA